METIVILLSILSAYVFGFMSGIIFDRFKYNKAAQRQNELLQKQEQQEMLKRTRRNRVIDNFKQHIKDPIQFNQVEVVDIYNRDLNCR